MKQTSLLVAIILVLSAGIVVGMSRPAYAAKQRVVWTPPTQNSDGTPLTDLTGYRIEWGTCTSTGAFGTYQAGMNVVGASVTSAWIYPTGMKGTVCVRIFSINSKNVTSVPAYASGPSPPVLSQPTP